MRVHRDRSIVYIKANHHMGGDRFLKSDPANKSIVCPRERPIRIQKERQPEKQ